MKKILTLLLFVSLSFVLFACGGDDEQPKEPTVVPSEGTVVPPTDGPTVVPPTPVVTPNTDVHYRDDVREALYGVYEADGTEVERHKSLYAAIVSCVDNCDLDAYVATSATDEALFINEAEFDVGTKDMFWHYKQGTVVSRYTAWESTYWTDGYAKGEICVFKEHASQELQPYANSHELVGVSTTRPAAASTAVWNSCWYLESSITVNLLAYSGITKAVYTIDLTEAKVYPTYEGTDEVWAYVGFITADSYNVSNQGLRCDTTTGNWYYYSGETAYNKNEIEVDDSKCLLTSTWDDAEQCYRPNEDVTLTMELLTIDDDYIVHRLTMEFSNGNKVVRDYEIAKLTMCGTIRFTAGLDIVSENTFPDYMNGAKFENVVVTSAVGTVLESMSDDLYTNLVELPAGDYNLLNSLPESEAKFHTILYTPSTISYNFDTAGKDVYSFSYNF